MLGGSLRPRPRATSHERSGGTTLMPSRVYSKDEELGKRDDDFRPKRSSTASSLAQPWRWRKRRLLTVIAVIVLVYVFVRNIPTDLGPVDQRTGVPLRPGHGVSRSPEAHQEPIGPPPKSGEGNNENKHYYDGPIKFYRLATSLRGIARTMGQRSQNRNVMFAVSSLRSAANLMPIACEMARWDRNYVHMTFLGRDPLPMMDILNVNGINMQDCSVFFHDARSDYSEYSSDYRAESAVAGAIKHINDFMHPQAIIMDDSAVEDEFFTRAMRAIAKELGRALIEVPARGYEEFFWITRLDSGSLSNWFKPNIDIFVRAPQHSSGSLIRLVKSLQSANYAGLRPPKLTIDLPPDIEPFAWRYLENLNWPPIDDPSPMRQSSLALHHRIPNVRLSSEQSSLRFLESFYPTSHADHHVLILSPQAEVSPLFLQYLHYVVLEYRYSSYGAPSSEDLLGISLDVPSAYLNGSGDFAPPVVADMHAEMYLTEADYDQTGLTPFLYQAPSAAASLIFGDKWSTMHNFLTNRLAASHSGKAEKTKKLVSETDPALLEYTLELMRARGWCMLQPATPFVTIHNELSHVPEEYERQDSEDQETETAQATYSDGEPFLTAPEPPVLANRIEHPPLGAQPLHGILPFDGDLPELFHLPYMSHTGHLINITRATDMVEVYVPHFRQQIGGCTASEAARKRIVHDLKTDDLFCLPGMELEFDVEAEVAKEVEEEIARQVIADTSATDDEEANEDDI